MNSALTGKRIAVTGGRRFKEISALITKLGGEAVLRPMMGSSNNDSRELAEVITTLCRQGADWLILVTGIGTRTLLAKAEDLGCGGALRSLLGTARLAARGYKTVKALKELGLGPQITDDDGTIIGLRRRLEPFDFQGQLVAVQLHGEPMPELTDWLSQRGAEVLEIPLYFYDPPVEADVQKLLFEMINGEVDAVAFTSNTQVRYLFEGAERQGQTEAVRRALNDRVIALAVGSVTSKALRLGGVQRIVAPRHERMGAMIMELAGYFGAQA